MKKKGLALVELMMSLALSSILLICAGDILIRHVSYEKQEKNRAREDFYADETFLCIEKLMYQAMEVRVENNVISVRRDFEPKRCWIRLYPNKKVLGVNYGYENSPEHNVINKDICKFNATVKGKLMYTSYTTSSGRSYERCIPINSPL